MDGTIPSMHVKRRLTVLRITTGRAVYVQQPMANSGHERSQTGMCRHGNTIAGECVSTCHRPNCLVLMGGQGQDRTVDLPLFRRTLIPTELPDQGGYAVTLHRYPGGPDGI
jgi:hypothetical protein